MRHLVTIRKPIQLLCELPTYRVPSAALSLAPCRQRLHAHMERGSFQNRVKQSFLPLRISSPSCQNHLSSSRPKAKLLRSALAIKFTTSPADLYTNPDGWQFESLSPQDAECSNAKRPMRCSMKARVDTIWQDIVNQTMNSSLRQ